jgi:hypothetical protein
LGDERLWDTHKREAAIERWRRVALACISLGIARSTWLALLRAAAECTCPFWSEDPYVWIAGPIVSLAAATLMRSCLKGNPSLGPNAVTGPPCEWKHGAGIDRWEGGSDTWR